MIRLLSWRKPTPADVLELSRDGICCPRISARLGMPIHEVRRIVREHTPPRQEPR